jgi:nucleoside-diphosphate-sugar epimerase
MSGILITGASGFIGRGLARSMAANHDVVCLSRHKPRDVDASFVRGKFDTFEDLLKLDPYDIDVLVHLAAVTGGCLESDCVQINVEGTRRLMRYLIDRGCRKFVMASSIAVVGFQSTKFRPLRLPIPDEHPCLDRDGYGLSKYLMEEITRYHQRQNEDIDVIDLRLSSVLPDDQMPEPRSTFPLRQWALGGITLMPRSDAVRAFTLAAEAPHKPGVRIMNTTCPKAWVAAPVADILRNWWGSEVDVSYYEQPGHEYDSVYDVSRIKAELGFVAERLP